MALGNALRAGADSEPGNALRAGADSEPCNAPRTAPDPVLLQALARHANHPSALVREHVAWAQTF